MSILKVQQLQHTNGTVGLDINTSGSVHIPGHVIQVVQNNMTGNHRVVISNSSFTTTSVTGTITPEFSTSKILVMVTTTGNTNQTNGTGIHATLYRGSTDLSATSTGFTTVEGRTVERVMAPLVITFLDSPATTSAVTYTLYAKSTTSSSIEVPAHTSATSTVVMMEIAQ
tara:strand:+ start:965 stop:1474 length:510 start_codon:yes stop_codon:yes gene_type:complete